MKPISNKPTVHDIAREAGVSLATVDRVLNERSGVREKTIAKVRAAVDRLGYVRDTHAANLARQKEYRFAFILPEGGGQFAQTLKNEIKEVFASQIADRTSIKVIGVPSYDPHLIVGVLRGLDKKQLDGIAIMAPESPQVRDAIDRIRDAGIAVVTIASDIPSSTRDYFIGVDNIAAGRTAAQLMGRFTAGQGEVLVITDTLESRDSLERRLGFDQVMHEEFPGVKVLPTVETYSEGTRAREIIFDISLRKPDLDGVYSMGFGNRPVIGALKNSGLASALTTIMHELTPVTRQALMAREITAVINQNSGHLIRSALRVLRNICDSRPIFDPQEQIRIEVVLKENLP